jgi:hypothetical protein
VPQIKRRIQIFAALRVSGCAISVKIRLEREVRKIIQQMTFVRDALADAAHVVIGGQYDAVLHGDHGLALLDRPAAATAAGMGFLWLDEITLASQHDAENRDSWNQ